MNLDDIKDTFQFLDDWEDKYRFIIDLGRDLPGLSDDQKTDEHIVRGCQSQVWLVANVAADGTLCLTMDSDAHIVRGLISIVLAAFNNKTPKEILATNINALFDELKLLEHLSPTRGNGLMAMLQRINSLASAQV
ncbi:MAG: cysteine desulfuration protein SufE [Candidatus Azotimanducaceae bacterium]|jgi:cysteine desulfuration protein SufE